jgi:hypothetical protein
MGRKMLKGRRRAVMPCTAQLVASLCYSRKNMVLEVRSSLPADAHFIGATYDLERDVFNLVFEHKSFDRAVEGGKVQVLPQPQISITCTE